MNIFVTGGPGFVGRRLVRVLLEKGHRVFCLVRDVPKSKEVLGGETQLVEGNLLDPLSKLVESLTGMDVVYHLAGNVFGGDKQEEFFRVNVRGTENLYRAATQSGTRRFIFMSSIAAVGPANRNQLITEEQPPQPVSVYGKSKLQAETNLKNLYESGKTELCIVRAPLIYGREMSPESRLAVLIQRLKKGSFKFVGNGENTVSLCQLDIVIDFLTYVIDIKGLQFEIFNIADPLVMTIRELVCLVAQHLKLKPPTFCIPFPLAYFAACCLDGLHNMLGINFYLTMERVRELVGNWGVDITKTREWHFEPQRDWHENFFLALDSLFKKV